MTYEKREDLSSSPKKESGGLEEIVMPDNGAIAQRDEIRRSVRRMPGDLPEMYNVKSGPGMIHPEPIPGAGGTLGEY